MLPVLFEQRRFYCFAGKLPPPEHLGDAVIPTTFTYAVRVAPIPERKFNVDLGIAQIANHIMLGADLKARHRVALGVSYGF